QIEFIVQKGQEIFEIYGAGRKSDTVAPLAVFNVSRQIILKFSCSSRHALCPGANFSPKLAGKRQSRRSRESRPKDVDGKIAFSPLFFSDVHRLCQSYGWFNPTSCMGRLPSCSIFTIGTRGWSYESQQIIQAETHFVGPREHYY